MSVVVMGTVSSEQFLTNGDPEHHMHVREAGITYLQENPERFIESNTENSWLEYLNNMSMQGTWSDAMIIQAVADQLQ